MKKLVASVGTVVLLSSLVASASSIGDLALTSVPDGKIVKETAEEVLVRTPRGSIVEVEFHRDGTFEEASGKALEQDVFVPVPGILDLKAAVGALKKAGKTPAGDWSLEKTFIKGWQYEFEGYEAGKKFEYLVDAKTGALTESRIDD